MKFLEKVILSYLFLKCETRENLMKGDISLEFELRNYDEKLKQITTVMYFSLKRIIEKGQYKYLENNINNKTLRANRQLEIKDYSKYLSSKVNKIKSPLIILKNQHLRPCIKNLLISIF